jgi:hypothetical protein
VTTSASSVKRRFRFFSCLFAEFPSRCDYFSSSAALLVVAQTRLRVGAK